MFVSPEIKARVDAKIRECIAIVKSVYNVDMKYPNVVYHKRGVTAGTASYVTWTVDFNPVLLNENVDAFIARTVPHEIAHLACYLIYPECYETDITFTRRGPRRAKRDVHGPSWQSIMAAFGADSKRCHNYDVTNSRVKKSGGRHNEYRCTRCSGTINLSDKHIAKLATDPYALWHRGCKGWKLVPADTPKDVQPVRPQPAVTSVPPQLFTGNKLQVCKNLYLLANGAPRATVIQAFISQAGCTPAGAATYYATCKKTFG